MNNIFRHALGVSDDSGLSQPLDRFSRPFLASLQDLVREQSSRTIELFLRRRHSATDDIDLLVVCLLDHAQELLSNKGRGFLRWRSRFCLVSHSLLDVARDLEDLAAAVWTCLDEEGVVILWHAGVDDEEELEGHD